MSFQVITGATMMCTFGAAPSVFSSTGTTMNMSGPPAANILENIPMANVPTFGVCMSIANPQVASATAAALGVLTPMPCVPMTPGPWAPGATKTMLKTAPALNMNCKLTCAWGGMISILVPGQFKWMAT